MSRDFGSIAKFVKKYGGRAPRYTSYPTAVQFSDRVDASVHSQWLADPTLGENPVSLYAHIPFCEKMCWYCGCHTTVVNKHAPIADYVERLRIEIGLTGQKLAGPVDVSALHFGGGTPNMLTPEEFVQIVAAFRQNFHFLDQAEIAVELDPRLLTTEWAQAAASAGVNRASLGVQDFDPNVQASVNRVQPYDLVAQSVQILRGAGISSLNLDLMYGLPHQDLESLEKSMDLAMTLDPDRMTLFGYAHVPWMKAHQNLIDEQALPQALARYGMQRRAAEILQTRGWTRLGLDHFAKPLDGLAKAAGEGRMRRNFQGYTTDQAKTLLGFGVSAISRLPKGYTQNASATPDWRARIAAGQTPVARGVAMTSEDDFRAEIIERLMCDFRVDLAEVCARHGRNAGELAHALERLDAMAADGLLRRENLEIEVLGDGRDFIRSVAMVFDAYVEADAKRHSLGV